MDPDETLTQIRVILGRIDLELPDYEQLAELVAGLDAWLAAGGFMPARWSLSLKRTR